MSVDLWIRRDHQSYHCSPVELEDSLKNDMTEQHHPNCEAAHRRKVHSFDLSLSDNESPVFKRTRTIECYQESHLSSRNSSSLPNLHERPVLATESVSDCISERRKFNLRLPSFQNPAWVLGDVSRCRQDDVREQILRPPQADSPTKSAVSSYGAVPLLTPPADEQISLSLLPESRSAPQTSVCSAGQGESSRSRQPPLDSTASGRLFGINLPGSQIFPDQSQIQGSPWITKATQTIQSSLRMTNPLPQIQLVSQTMPSQAMDSRIKPTFEEVLETLQSGMGPSPFITITHAVPEVRIMEELPKTPPSTPGARHDINDYFGGDQTIFTHAAVVPIYHNYGRLAANSAAIPHHIAAPYSIQVSILERYIPPTMPLEITDFFSLSHRSYLSNRLSELSAHNGSLLLVYPTKTGGRTFTQKYIGPVLDPLLRQFVLLNDMTFDAAVSMGTMSAVEQMLAFEEMTLKVKDMCSNLTQRPAIRGQRSAYKITYCEKTEVVLDRSTWVDWYVEQEQPRLRQNLVEYHQRGGRMPGATGNSEVTTGMLTREIVDGIRKSKEHSGNTGIEVGVFVITRSTL